METTLDLALDEPASGPMISSALRAIEWYRSPKRRLFHDPTTHQLLPRAWRTVVGLLRLPLVGRLVLALRERQTPGVIGSLLCRSRYIDDALKTALDGGVDQVVILGAGFDSRPYRIPDIDRIQLFEVDHPAAQAAKFDGVARLLGHPPDHVSFVPADMNLEGLTEALDTAGLNPGRPCFVIWEGTTQYLPASAVDATLRSVAELSAPGSQLVLSYILRGVIDGSAWSETDEKVVRAAEKRGGRWIFGLSRVELRIYLAARGFELIEDVGEREYRKRYLEPCGRQMPIYQGERVALSQRA